MLYILTWPNTADESVSECKLLKVKLNPSLLTLVRREECVTIDLYHEKQHNITCAMFGVPPINVFCQNVPNDSLWLSRPPDNSRISG